MSLAKDSECPLAYSVAWEGQYLGSAYAVKEEESLLYEYFHCGTFREDLLGMAWGAT